MKMRTTSLYLLTGLTALMGATIASAAAERGGRASRPDRDEVVSRFDGSGNGEIDGAERKAVGQARAEERRGRRGHGRGEDERTRRGHGGPQGKNGYGGPNGQNGFGHRQSGGDQDDAEGGEGVGRRRGGRGPGDPQEGDGVGRRRGRGRGDSAGNGRKGRKGGGRAGDPTMPEPKEPQAATRNER